MQDILNKFTEPNRSRTDAIIINRKQRLTASLRSIATSYAWFQSKKKIWQHLFKLFWTCWCKNAIKRLFASGIPVMEIKYSGQWHASTQRSKTLDRFGQATWVIRSLGIRRNKPERRKMQVRRIKWKPDAWTPQTSARAHKHTQIHTQPLSQSAWRLYPLQRCYQKSY